MSTETPDRPAHRGLARQRRLTRWIARTRIVAYVVIAVLVAYHVWRYDLTQMPPDGISPLEDVPPGARLVVDTHSSALARGDAVLYRAQDGTLLLGRVDALPPSAPREVWEQCENGSHWIRKDRPDLPGPDSLLLGPIDPEAIEGRIALVLPW